VALPRRSTLKFVRKPQAKLHSGALGIYQRIILRWTLEKVERECGSDSAGLGRDPIVGFVNILVITDLFSLVIL